MELKEGTFLHTGKYKIEKKLGQGSFGITYLATAKFSTDSGLGKMDVKAKVCIKEFFMSDVNSRKEDGSTVEGSSGSVFSNYRRKFRKEAENLAKLSHPNIVRVFDVFDENDTTYYAMEFLEGENLDDYIKSRGRIPEEESITIFREIGGALSYMHSKKMLHLDIKPKNVMHRNDSRNFLIDFGLSKQYTADGEPESSTSIGLGTPGYAPLEQSQYKQDGTFPATLDVYALGATLFKMLTGKRPPEPTIILNEGFPKNLLLESGVSMPLSDIIEKSMLPSKKHRFQTINEFLSAISDTNTEEKTIIKNSDKIKEFQSQKEEKPCKLTPQSPTSHKNQSISNWIYANIIIDGIFTLSGLVNLYRLTTNLATNVNSITALLLIVPSLIIYIVYIKKLKKLFLYLATAFLTLGSVLSTIDPDHPDDIWFGIIVAAFGIIATSKELHNHKQH